MIKKKDYKDSKKKVFGLTYPIILREIHGIDIYANAVKKRWSYLRDQFSRENRKKKTIPSGSGSDVKEWELYKIVMFLLPHIAHRRTKTSFSQPGNLTQQLSVEVHTNDADYYVEKGSQPVLEKSGPELWKGIHSVDEATTSSCKMRKITPEYDDFSNRKAGRYDSIDRELVKVFLLLWVAWQNICKNKKWWSQMRMVICRPLKKP